MMYKTYYNSPLGKLILISDGTYLTNLLLEASDYSEETIENDNLKVFKEIKSWLTTYFNGIQIENKNLPLKPTGSEFRTLVWDYLLTIPYGKTVTYKEIANFISKKTKKSPCPQAIGGAVGNNNIPIIIPCHRVVGTNKNLTGYTGGLHIKKKLLELEGINTSEYTMPKKRGER